MFQLGEGPSKGLLRDYEPLDGPSFQALHSTLHNVGQQVAAGGGGIPPQLQ